MPSLPGGAGGQVHHEEGQGEHQGQQQHRLHSEVNDDCITLTILDLLGLRTYAWPLVKLTLIVLCTFRTFTWDLRQCWGDWSQAHVSWLISPFIFHPEAPANCTLHFPLIRIHQHQPSHRGAARRAGPLLWWCQWQENYTHCEDKVVKCLFPGAGLTYINRDL